MSNFDKAFESKQLALLANQYPEVLEMYGEVTFYAERDEDRLSSASWYLDEDDFKLASETGFKFQLLELLDKFIQYRGQSNEDLKKQCVVHFAGGDLNIIWLTDQHER